MAGDAEAGRETVQETGSPGSIEESGDGPRPDGQRDEGPRGEGSSRSSGVYEEYFKKGMLIIAMLLVLMATFGLYFSVKNVIETWFEYQYVPIFQSAYYIIVIAVGLYFVKSYIIGRSG